MSTTALPELWDIDRLAAYLGVGHRFIYRLTSEGRIRYRHVGGRLRFEPSDIEAYLQRELFTVDSASGPSFNAAFQAVFLELAELARIEAAMDPHSALVVSFTVECALRIGEVSAIRVRDVDLDLGIVYVRAGAVYVSRQISGKETRRTELDGKTNAAIRAVPMLHPGTADRLRAMIADRRLGPNDLLFTGKRGGPLDPSNWRAREFSPAVDAAGLGGEESCHIASGIPASPFGSAPASTTSTTWHEWLVTALQPSCTRTTGICSPSRTSEGVTRSRSSGPRQNWPRTRAVRVISPKRAKPNRRNATTGTCSAKKTPADAFDSSLLVDQAKGCPCLHEIRGRLTVVLLVLRCLYARTSLAVGAEPGSGQGVGLTHSPVMYGRLVSAPMPSARNGLSPRTSGSATRAHGVL